MVAGTDSSTLRWRGISVRLDSDDVPASRLLKERIFGGLMGTLEKLGKPPMKCEDLSRNSNWR